MIAPRPEIDIKIDRWQSSLASYQPLVGTSDQKEAQRHALPQIDVLAEIFDEFKKRAAIKAKWQNWKFSASPWDISMTVYQRTQRTRCPFDLIFYKDTICLRSSLEQEIYLRYATDEFWIELAKLCEETNVKWDTNQWPADYKKTEMNRLLFNTEKSVFFCMMRNYIIGMQLEEGKGGIGDFSLTWPLSGDWHKMLEEGSKAVRRIHALNYHLWRWHYQTTYRWLKKDAKERGYDFSVALKQFFPDED